MPLLSRADILKPRPLPAETVHVPDWGGDVVVRTLSGAERDAFEAANLQGRGRNQRVNLHNLRARLVALCVVDADGKRVFSDEDAEALGRQSARALDQVFAVASRLNGISEGDLEELEKNSASAPSNGSTTP